MAGASIELTRGKGWTDRIRAYKVAVDGEVVDTIRAHETKSLDVVAGAHTVQLQIDWCRSPILQIDVGESELVRLRCGPNATPLTIFYFITVGRARYIRLERASSELGP